MTTPLKAFVSVGRTSTPEQEAFVAAIEAHMVDRGVTPQALNRNYWTSKQPLAAVDELMAQCSGAAIIGFERLRIVQGIVRRGSPEESALTDCALPTVWNQIETALAYSRGLPLLVILEQSIRAEGLLETTHDWYVKRVPLEAGVVADREFRGIFDDWRRRVEAFHATRSKPAPAHQQTGSSPSLETGAVRTEATLRKRLRLILEQRFSDDELRQLCFDANVDFENLPGETHAGKTISLITYFERMRRVDELVLAVKELRPDESL